MGCQAPEAIMVQTGSVGQPGSRSVLRVLEETIGGAESGGSEDKSRGGTRLGKIK